MLDHEIADALGLSVPFVRYRKRQLQLRRDQSQPASCDDPIGGPNYVEKQFMSEEEIASLYDVCGKYEDHPKARGGMTVGRVMQTYAGQVGKGVSTMALCSES